MTKKEQLAEYVTQDVIAYLMENYNMDWDIAMQRFYLSQTFEKLQNFETGLYKESSSYVYDLLCDELLYGKIIQNEQ